MGVDWLGLEVRFGSGPARSTLITAMHFRGQFQRNRKLFTLLFFTFEIKVHAPQSFKIYPQMLTSVVKCKPLEFNEKSSIKSIFLRLAENILKAYKLMLK